MNGDRRHPYRVSMTVTGTLRHGMRAYYRRMIRDLRRKTPAVATLRLPPRSPSLIHNGKAPR